MSYKVIDISKHQGSINFDEVKKENLYGIILRCGYTGYGSSKSKQKDEKFEEYYKECERLKIPVGVYWYSCASSVNEAKEEANLTLEYIKDKKIELPVFFDTEDEHHQRELSKSVLSNIVKTFCEEIENAGYYCGIYASTSWFNSELDMNYLNVYDVWVADYRGYNGYNGNCGMWQYSSKGKINGINKNVDLNHCYKDYINIIKNNNLNNLNGKIEVPETVKPVPQTYVVKSGDCLWNIAKKFLGRGSRYTEIMSLNNLTSDVIKPGQVLKINTTSTVVKNDNITIGDTVSFDYLYKDSYGNGKVKSSIKSGIVTKIVDTSRKAPYLINDGAGWVSKDLIK